MKGKLDRQRIIKGIVKRQRVSNQEELSRILEREGLVVAQATLSRDIKELGVTKLHDGDGYYYSLPRTTQPHAMASTAAGIHDSIVSIEFSGAMAVVKTLPGHANMVASIIDSGSVPEAAGTIAGDDTIFLVMREGAVKEDLLGSLGSIFNGLETKRLD